MIQVTVEEAAKLTGKSIPTLYRDIKAGKLPTNPDGTIDKMELLQVYGLIKVYEGEDDVETPISDHRAHTLPRRTSRNDLEIEVDWLKSQVEKLHNEIKELKSEAFERERRAVERENRTMALLEHQVEAESFWNRLSAWLKGKRNID